MHVDLVAGPEDMSTAVPELNGLIDRFAFTPGNRYAEFRPGDKIATYGLTALMAGGAGAAMAKSGLLSKIWKFLVLAAIARNSGRIRARHT